MHRGRLAGPRLHPGDHYQFNAKKYAADPDGVSDVLKKATLRAMAAGYGNIDIDSSTLVDLSLDTVDAQQRANYTRAAEIAALIRANEDPGLTVSIGGEIGEVGKQNSTEEELRVYLAGFRRELDARAGSDTIGLSKVSVATGTSHGGVPLPGGGVAEVKLDFGTLARLSAVCRESGLSGAVQHGASTLPDELFHHFPKAETAEIHLATGFQNALFETKASPQSSTRPSSSSASTISPPSASKERPIPSSSTRLARRRWVNTNASSGISTPRSTSWPTRKPR